MRIRKQIWLIVFLGLFVPSCVPFMPSAPAATLDPLSMQTAIAQTASAAQAQTAAVAQGPQPSVPPPVLMEGPTLNPQEFGTAVALTAEAARSGTQAMLPDTLTPSVTPLPSQVSSITPTATSTFLWTFVPTVTRFPATPTGSSQKKKGGGGGGSDPKSPYICKVLSVSPDNGSILPPNAAFDVVWQVKNKNQNWPKKKVYISYVEGTLIPLMGDSKKLGPLSQYDISGGDVVEIEGISLRTPAVAGTYSTTWMVTVEDIPACTLKLTVVVQASLTEEPLERMEP